MTEEGTAEAVGATLQSVSTTVGKLRDEGLVACERRAVSSFRRKKLAVFLTSRGREAAHARSGAEVAVRESFSSHRATSRARDFYAERGTLTRQASGGVTSMDRIDDLPTDFATKSWIP